MVVKIACTDQVKGKMDDRRLLCFPARADAGKDGRVMHVPMFWPNST